MSVTQPGVSLKYLHRQEMNSDQLTEVVSTTQCYHCGDDCKDQLIQADGKTFCCDGCSAVYAILNDKDLCDYYTLNQAAGISQKRKASASFAFLDDPETIDRIIDFRQDPVVRVHFYLPQIHCSSCLWLLENLHQLSEGIISSRVHFLKKEVHIQYDESVVTLRQVVETLDLVGYTPVLNLDKLDKKADKRDKSLFYKLGVAGFAFGNIMLISFPEYFGLDADQDRSMANFFGILNILLILPVVFYSGRDYLISAYYGIRQRHLNIDVPVSIGILALFGKSIYDIVSHSGAGYLDSLAGLIFFLLIGKWYQQRTYEKISFDRDYKSYFPMSAMVLVEGSEQPRTIDQIEMGDLLVIRHGELVPTDAILKKGKGVIDYSFVTGESDPVKVYAGEKIFAGGRQKGGLIELEVQKKVDQSYLTSLWNDEAFSKSEDKRSGASILSDKVATYFTAFILTIAVVTLLFWWPRDLSIAINAFTSVLIIACPCAVALAIPFTLGNTLRVLGHYEFYVKNTYVLEKITQIKQIIFDKTGTITHSEEHDLEYNGQELDESTRLAVSALTNQSTHPVSQLITRHWRVNQLPVVENFIEIPNQGITGEVNGRTYRVGASSLMPTEVPNVQGTHLAVDDQYLGYFMQRNHYRSGLKDMITSLAQYSTFLLTGDHPSEKERLGRFFHTDQMYFNQRPEDKLEFIRKQQQDGEITAMIGDGLNDAGALKQSDIGIVVSEHVNNFIPACDAVLSAPKLIHLPMYIDYIKSNIQLIYITYLVAIAYNIVGLSFAVQGLLSPVIAAILMPLSSITIVLLGVSGSNLLGWRMRRKLPRQKPTELHQEKYGFHKKAKYGY